MALAAAILLAEPAAAATITVHAPDGEGRVFVDVLGTIIDGDFKVFQEKTDQIYPIGHPKKQVIVTLLSYGGILGPALQIAELIRKRGMSTFVPSDRTCTSACALIWLAGLPRTVGSTPQVGFHAFYDPNTRQETGAANAVVGAYLRDLGFGVKAIVFMTRKGPTSVEWLTPDLAKEFGVSWAELQPPREMPVPPQPKVPPHWTPPAQLRASWSKPGSPPQPQQPASIPAYAQPPLLTDDDVTAQGPAELDVRIVPGTKWRSSVTKAKGEYVSCQITAFTNEAELRLVIGSKGSLVMLLRDRYQENVIRDTLGWRDNQIYRAALFIDKHSPIAAQAERIWEHTLVIPLSNMDPTVIFAAKRIAIAIGGISMRSYDVAGLSTAKAPLYECYRIHGRRLDYQHLSSPTCVKSDGMLEPCEPARVSEPSTTRFCVSVIEPPTEVVKDPEYNGDKWLALREGPGPQFKLITKLGGYELLEADTTEGDWTRISNVKRLSSTERNSRQIVQGWVRSKYVKKFPCVNETADQPKSGTTRPEEKDAEWCRDHDHKDAACIWEEDPNHSGFSKPHQ